MSTIAHAEIHKPVSEAPPVAKQTVIMIHGIARSVGTFRRLQSTLQGQGYNAISLRYPSTRAPIEEHANSIASFLDQMETSNTISFITHSMGGLVLRLLLAKNAASIQRHRIGRIVMIAPPNRGSRIADTFKNYWPYKVFYGPAGQQLIPSNVDKIPGLAGRDFAVIAGGRSKGKGYNPFLSGDNDGTVAVAETRLDGERDSLVIPAIHARITNHPQTVDATISFLKHGTLQEASELTNQRERLTTDLARRQ